MTPQTVNAYYNPGVNEICFPAAILRPPFFEAGADPALNYGGIGAVIGHEIGHGFDDQGSQYDGEGNLENWWTDDDRAHFSQLADKLIAQYDGFEPRTMPGHHVNGALTVGENIGDLGGLTIALLAYELSLGGQDAPVIDGRDRSRARADELGVDLAHQDSSRTRAAAVVGRSAFARRVPRQHRPQSRRVPRRVRHLTERRIVARTEGPRSHLVTSTVPRGLTPIELGSVGVLDWPGRLREAR